LPEEEQLALDDPRDRSPDDARAEKPRPETFFNSCVDA